MLSHHQSLGGVTDPNALVQDGSYHRGVMLAQVEMKIGRCHVDMPRLDGLAVPGMPGGKGTGSTEYAGEGAADRAWKMDHHP
jgi:hypothetical protein